MNKFIQKLSYLSISVIIYLIALQMLISWRIEGKSVNGQDNLEQCANVNAALVFIGNSRCITSFMPEVFSKKKISAINLGLHGHPSLNFIEVRINDYLTRNKRLPKLICFTLDVFSEPSSKHSILMKDRFARYAFIPKSNDISMLDYFEFNFAERYIPAFSMLKYRKIWDALLLNNQSQWLEIGMESESISICGTENNLPTQDLLKIYRPQHQDEKLVKDLKILKNKYQKLGVKMVAVQVPVYKSIYNQRFLATHSICQKAGIPLLDLAIPQYNSECSLFKDLNHLNTNGASKISDSLAKFILAKKILN